jgi:hypothetical protein
MSIVFNPLWIKEKNATRYSEERMNKIIRSTLWLCLVKIADSL